MYSAPAGFTFSRRQVEFAPDFPQKGPGVFATFRFRYPALTFRIRVL